MIIYILLILTTNLVSEALEIYTDVDEIRCRGDCRHETTCLVPKARKSDFIYLEARPNSKRSERTCSSKGSYTLKVISDQVYLTIYNKCGGIFKIVKAECGVGDDSSEGFKVFYGLDASSCRQFPWMASVTFGSGVCGGSIINRNHILTAAHCITYSRYIVPSVSSIKISVGSTLFQKGKQLKLNKIFIHEQYADPMVSADHGHDIAILRLAEDLKFDECQRPICLANSPDILEEPEVRNNCRISGWGRTEHSILPSHLIWVDMELVSDYLCSLYYHSYFVSNSTICALPPNNYAGGHCSGDSGSPLICKWGSKWQEYGVVSLNRVCGQHPGAYIGVPFYYDWIISKINSP